MDYKHVGHGEIEYVESYKGYDDKVEVYRCVDCHVVAEPQDADKVFDEYDCEQYENVRKGITDNL